MGIKILGIENTRHIPETVCARLKDYGYQVTVVSRDRYHRNSEDFASYDLAPPTSGGAAAPSRKSKRLWPC